MQYDAAIIGAARRAASSARPTRRTRALVCFAYTPKGAHFDLYCPNHAKRWSGTRRVRYYQRYYLNMDRYAFDRWLVSLVPPTVEIVRGRCTAVSRTDGGFAITVRTAEGARSFTCRCLIGADGARSIVRESTGAMASLKWFRATDKAHLDPETESCSRRRRNLRRLLEKANSPETRTFGHDFGELVKTGLPSDRPRHWRDFVTGADVPHRRGREASSASLAFEASNTAHPPQRLADAFGENYKSYRKSFFPALQALLKIWTDGAQRVERPDCDRPRHDIDGRRPARRRRLDPRAHPLEPRRRTARYRPQPAFGAKTATAIARRGAICRTAST